tara:strand:- start:94 stop:756 length:663 start_codon:yes stop_codon:yes gene_type:complete
MKNPIKKITTEENNLIKKQKKDLLLYWLNSQLVINESVLQAFKSVQREFFVDSSYRDLSYSDQPLPIDSGQTISQPTTVIIMLQLLNVFPENHVLEIGTGSGYNAALLAKIARSVVTIERHKKLAKQALKNLKKSNLTKVKVIEGDGKLGYKNLAPYDRIIVTAAANQVPESLKSQLRLGGLLVAPIGPTFGCEMLKIKKISPNNFQTSSHGLFSFVPLK